MKIYVHDLKQEDLDYSLSEKDAWLQAAVSDADETTDGTADRTIECHLNANKQDELIYLQGNLRTRFSLLCSRCGETYFYPGDLSFTAMFTQNSEFAGNSPENTLPAKGPVNMKTADEEMQYLTTDFIDVDAVLREQIQLTLPVHPLCEPECKGRCLQCGVNRNTEECHCPEITRTNPFSVLKNFKLG